MSQRLGMDPGAARAKRDAMQAQVDALRHISGELTTTISAARSPQVYGIEPGERTVAPFSMGYLTEAGRLLQNARSAANHLLLAIDAEAAAQEQASANDQPVVDFVNEFRRTRTFFISGPSAWLQTPAALGTIRAAPFLIGNALKPSSWFSMREYNLGKDTLNYYVSRASTNVFVRGTALKADAFKADKLLIKAAAQLNASQSSWVAKSAQWLSKASTVVGKGAGVLSAGIGAYNLYNGIVGMTDGDSTDADKWAVADGAVGLITGIGSLMPPPVGVVFAAVGAGYAVGRWLFGADENGMTGVDHVGNFFTDLGTNVAADYQERSQAAADFVADPLGTTRDVLADPVGSARAVIDNLWPW